MEIKDFTVVVCPKNHYNILYGANELSSKDLMDEFEAEIIDGKITTTCHCGEMQVEIPYSKWPLSVCSEVLGNMLEDDNRHSLTGIGHLIDFIMKERHYSVEQRTDVIKGLLEYYDKHHSLQF